jgi:acetoin utilization deacetylase AcuC-like enzyme
MPLPLVHHPQYVAPLPQGHRFPMPKFNLLRDVLIADGVATPQQFHPPEPATRDQLTLVHHPDYVDAYCNGHIAHDLMRRIGLPWSHALAHRTVRALGGTLLATRLACEHGLAANCAGGTHHAFHDFGAGFCIFNDLAVATRWAQREGLADHVLIIDLDVHQGDGTAALLAQQPHTFTFSMHCDRNFPLKKQRSSIDISLPVGMADADYLDVLHNGCPIKPDNDQPRSSQPFDGLEKLLERLEPDLVLYDAGVDPHIDDALGKLALSDDGLYERDLYVIQQCRAHRIPTVCVIGGGYDTDHLRLARRHSTVHRAATAVFNAADEHV